MPHNSKELLTEFFDKILPYSSLWALWGIALQLNELRKWTKFRFWMWLSNVMLSAWIWYIAWNFIPESVWDIKFSLISISWFLAYPILDLIEKKWLSLLIKKLSWEK